MLAPPPGQPGLSTNSAVILGPLVPNEARRVEPVLDASLGTEALIDEPVASGGDSSLWDGDDEDEEEEEPK